MTDVNPDSQNELQPLPGLSLAETRIVALVAAGKPAVAARKLVGLSDHMYRRLRAENPAFERELAQARAILQEDRVDKMYEIANDQSIPTDRAKVIIDAIKWEAGKLNKQYGDRLDLTVTERPDLNAALAEARNRALVRPMRDLPDVTVTQVIDSTCDVVPRPVDNESTSDHPDIFS